MYLRNVSPGSYSATVNYLVVDSQGSFSVPTLLVYKTSNTFAQTDAASIYAEYVDDADKAKQEGVVAVQVVSSESTTAEIVGLDFNTSYTVALGDVSMSSDATTFKQYDIITFTTESLSMDFQVVRLTQKSIAVTGELMSDFDVSSGYYFYIAAYQYDTSGDNVVAKVIAKRRLTESELKAFRTSGGFSGNLNLDDDNDLTKCASSITVMLGYTDKSLDSMSDSEVVSGKMQEVTVSNTIR
jgi:hypothetical protein